MALTRRTLEDGPLCHSDQGNQYASEDYQALLDQAGITCSMSRRGDCYSRCRNRKLLLMRSKPNLPVTATIRTARTRKPTFSSTSKRSTIESAATRRSATQGPAEYEARLRPHHRRLPSGSLSIKLGEGHSSDHVARYAFAPKIPGRAVLCASLFLCNERKIICRAFIYKEGLVAPWRPRCPPWLHLPSLASQGRSMPLSPCPKRLHGRRKHEHVAEEGTLRSWHSQDAVAGDAPPSSGQSRRCGRSLPVRGGRAPAR